MMWPHSLCNPGAAAINDLSHRSERTLVITSEARPPLVLAEHLIAYWLCFSLPHDGNGGNSLSQGLHDPQRGPRLRATPKDILTSTAAAGAHITTDPSRRLTCRGSPDRPTRPETN